MNQKIPVTRPRREPSGPAREFTVQLSSTRRGARLGRLLATEQLRSWGLLFDAAVQVVAELTANAALHGRVSDRDFRLRMVAWDRLLRVEVTDTRGDRLPAREHRAAPDAESGRGLVVVELLATRWGTRSGPPPCKTVWAEVELPY
ncbi:ATP-binding protein [Streptomyces sp. NPDC050560]|uniref:ATP-binding protein n=1 Tax=Streptomyces sp. NPDC050560 TaxID=3365630 RepID=UPI00379DFEE1